MNKLDLQQIKSRLDFVELVQRYLELRPTGERWTGRCPFHHETKPSFHVIPSQGFYYCFGCQASGDVIDFYARINGMDFKQAVIQLARETGVELDFKQISPQEKKDLEELQVYLRMYALSAAHFQRNLASVKGALPQKYLRDRGVSKEMVDEFSIGWSLPDWHSLGEHLRSKGYGQGLATACGLLVKNEQGNVYDRFRNRIMFPIHDLSGKIIAFGGRAVDNSEPKYINSSETPIYTKGRHLYGLHQARRAIVRDKRALLTEGYLDVVALHQFGFKSAVGVLGTALTGDQVKRLAGFCSRVDLLFDGDQAGLKAALRAAVMFLAQGLTCAVTTMPEGEDVDSVLHAQGPEVLQNMINAATDGLDFCLQTLAKTHAPRQILDWVRQFLGSVVDEGLRTFYLPRIAAGLGISETELRRTCLSSGGLTGPKTAWLNIPGKRLTGKDRQLLGFAVSCPEYRTELAANRLDIVLENPWAKSLWDKLLALDPGHDYSALDEEERGVCYQLLADSPVRKEDDRVLFWSEVREFLTKLQVKKKQQDVLQALRQAQMQGDQQRVTELLKAYQDLAMEA
jgi:DNA primase